MKWGRVYRWRWPCGCAGEDAEGLGSFITYLAVLGCAFICRCLWQRTEVNCSCCRHVVFYAQAAARTGGIMCCGFAWRVDDQLIPLQSPPGPDDTTH
jgi:hypothetical protein